MPRTRAKTKTAPIRTPLFVETPSKLQVLHLAKNLGISEAEARTQLHRENLLHRSYDVTTLEELRLVVQELIRMS